MVSEIQIRTHQELTDIGQDNEADYGDANVVPALLVVVEEEVSVFASNAMTGIGPSDVEEGQNSESQDVGTKWLMNVSVGGNGRRERYLHLGV